MQVVFLYFNHWKNFDYLFCMARVYTDVNMYSLSARGRISVHSLGSSKELYAISARICMSYDLAIKMVYASHGFGVPRHACYC